MHDRHEYRSSACSPRSRCWLVGTWLVVAGCTAQSAAPPLNLATLPPAANSAVDFARDIQPIFAAHCLKCHGAEKQKSEFRLDLKAAALRGGENGAAIVPGRSADSPLVHYVAGLVEDRVMPPKGARLTVAQISLLRAWIDQGAVWPETADNARVKDKRDHWAFQPASRPALPAVRTRGGIRNPIDPFIVARLEREHLKPAPAADRVTLIRRLTFDLHGLPPTPEEVDAFERDRRPEAYEKLVDRLLASPRYGERWARHWLDVVHFGESHGYDKDKPRPNAWPYRDYVIQSFNADKPYARFVQEQLAGDVLFPGDPAGVIATGFIAAGPWDYVGHAELPITKTDGLIARYNDRDDMVMTTMATFQSLTVHCARCHDHKFDPITQRDYYRLQAVFAGVDRADRPIDGDPAVFARRAALLAEKRTLAAGQRQLDERVAKLTSAKLQQLDARLAAAKATLAALPAVERSSPANGYHSAIESAADIAKWVEVDLGSVQPIDEVRLVPARPTDFADTPGFGFPKRFRVELAEESDSANRLTLAGQTTQDFPNPGDVALVLPAQRQRARFVRVTATRLWERTHDYVFALAELQVFSGTNNLALGREVRALDSIEAGRWGKARLVDGFDSRKFLGGSAVTTEAQTRREQVEAEVQQLGRERSDEVQSLLDEPTRTALVAASKRLGEVKNELEALPPPQLVYAAASEFTPIGSFRPPDGPRPIHLLKRGDVKSPGELMAPGAVAALPGLAGDFALADSADEGARRAALARWITDPQNLLTRRSIVNRVWQHHFGRGLVDSPNDFGHMGSLPSHPELLDWLAYWFQDHGESLKELHRLIVTSATYRQSSRSRPEDATRDGDNRLLGRRTRQRLDAESFHDALLSVAGRLDLTMGGPSVQQFFFKDDHSPVYDYTRYDVDGPGSGRRSIYRFIVRSVPDPFLECLDAADPALLTPQRTTTLTALQALASLNDPFVLRQCEHFAARVAAASADPRRQIETVYRLALNRQPTPAETSRLAAYASRHGLVNACRVLVNSAEFLFVD